MNTRRANFTTSVPYSQDFNPPPLMLVETNKKLLLLAVIIAQLLSFVPLAAVSVYVVRVMCTTSILHLNLRLLFVWHAVAGLLYGVGKVYMDMVNLLVLHTPLFPFTGSIVDKFITRFGGLASLYVTPVLVVERIMATRAVNTYEQKQGRHYILYTLMLLVLGLIAFALARDLACSAEDRKGANAVTLIVIMLNVVSSTIAYLILLLVLRYNERKYKDDLRKPIGHSLSKRYQRSENIRASRQLLPVILLHMLQNIPPSGYFYMVYSGSLKSPFDYLFYSAVFSLASFWLYLALLVPIITSHPILRRDAIAKLRRWPCCRSFGWGLENRVTPVSYDNNVAIIMGPAFGIAQWGLKTIDGLDLIPQIVNLQDEHFKNLGLFWRVNNPHNTGISFKQQPDAGIALVFFRSFMSTAFVVIHKHLLVQ